jgi:hypothetical protein
LFATTREAVWDENRGIPRVPIKVHDEGDYRRFKDVPEQVAFSVLGGGLARPGKVNGETGRIVESMTNVRSVDWVTEAGAGGAIDFAESAAQEHEDIKMEVETLSDEQIKAEAVRRGLIRESDGDDKAEAKVEDGEATATASTPSGGTLSDSEVRAADEKEQDESGAGPKIEDTKAEEPAAEEAETKESAEAPDVEALVQKAVADALAKERKDRETETEVKESAKKAVAAELAESNLPKYAKDIIVTSFREATFGAGSVWTDEPALRGAVRGEVAKAAALLGLKERPSKVAGLGDNEAEGSPVSVTESVASRIDQKFGPSGVPKGEATAADGEEAIVSESGRSVEDRIAGKFGRA